MQFPPPMPEVAPGPVPQAQRMRNPMPGASLGQLKKQLLKSRLFGHDLPFEMLQDGPPHAKVFTYLLSVPSRGGDPQQARGSATTKKEAERICFADAVRLLS